MRIKQARGDAKDMIVAQRRRLVARGNGQIYDSHYTQLFDFAECCD